MVKESGDSRGGTNTCSLRQHVKRDDPLGEVSQFPRGKNNVIFIYNIGL